MFSEQVIIVTGGARGIGRATAEGFCRQGGRAALFDLSVEAGRQAEAEMRQAGYEARFHQVDITDQAQVDRAVAAVVAEWGRVDVLVNNAGYVRHSNFVEQDAAEWQKVVAVNFVGALYCTHAALRPMTARGYGRVVFVASDAARVGTKGEAVYAGAKSALIGFTKSLALEVAGAGVTVNVVSPGSTDTELFRSAIDAEGIMKRERANPLKRLGKPTDVANAVLFFASPATDYVTGQIFSVNGGAARIG